MSCCKDVMKPIEASLSIRRKTRWHKLRERYASQAVAARPWLRIQNTSSWSASSPNATCVAALRLMTAVLPRFALKRSCVPCLRVVVRMSQLKKRAGNSMSIARRACPLWTRRAAAAAQRADHSDDPKLSDRIVVAMDAELPIHRQRPASDRSWRGLVMTSVE